MDPEFRAILIVIISCVLVVLGVTWYAASVESDVWNRCHPSQQQITTWEALWTKTRIDNCETQGTIDEN